MDALKEFFDSIPVLGPFLIIMARLFANYFTHGLFFFALHMIVVWLFYQTWYSEVRVETDALERWTPRGPTPTPEPRGGRRLTWLPRRRDEAETTRILDEFVADCDKLGCQGVFIPLTDFSDRLDSIVDGVTSEMHDRTNLFILVGVAGTLLGLFEFAFEAHEALKLAPEQTLPTLLDALTSSMSKAFPVGFVGLLLTFVSQVAASFPERRLRTALAQATSKALAAREETTRSHVSALQDSVRMMQETMSSSVTAMESAMRPLANLQQTLGGFLEPTMNELSRHLDSSLKLVVAQHEEMKKTNEGTQEIVNSAKHAVAELREVARSQVEQAEKTREANEAAVGAVREQRESLAAFNAAFDATIGRVQAVNENVARAAENFEALPGRLHDAAQLAFDRLALDTLSVWRAASDELKHEIAGEHERLLDGAAAQAGEIHTTLMSASSQLADVAAGVGASAEGLKELPGRLEAQMNTIFTSLAGASTEYWNRGADTFMGQMSSLQARFLDVIREKTEDVEQSLKKASDSLTEISRRMDIILGDSLKAAIREAKAELGAGLRDVHRVVVEQYPQLSQNVLTLSDGLREAVARSGDIHRESAAWLSEIQGAYGKLEEINRVLADALARASEEVSPTNAEQVRGLLQQNVEELKGLSRSLADVGRLIPAPGQVQSVSNELRDGLARSSELLTRIHRVLAARAAQEAAPPRRPFWRRLLGRRGSNGAVDGAAAHQDGEPEREIRR